MPSALAESVGVKDRLLDLIAIGEAVTSGEATKTETVIGTAWAHMEGLTGLNRNGLTAEADYRFTIWYRTDLTARIRLGLNGTARRFQMVVPPLDREGRKIELTILAKEILA